MWTTCSSTELHSNPERFLKGASGVNKFGLTQYNGRPCVVKPGCVWLSQAVCGQARLCTPGYMPR